MSIWQSLVSQSNRELAMHPSAKLNFLCAEGLPGTEHWDVARCAGRIKEMAAESKRVTQENFWQFQKHPEAFNHSEANYRAIALVTALQQNCGVGYNPAKIPETAAFGVSDTFVYGVILGEGGTCASLPVLYATVGQYLGYPLRLVRAKTPRWAHFFLRWEDDHDRFNIETTAQGFVSKPDDYYRKYPYMVTPEEERQGFFLQTMKPRDELATFLLHRHHCWEELENDEKSVEAVAWASSLSPGNHYYANMLTMALNRWTLALEHLRPPHFPPFEIHTAGRRFPSTMPLKIERDILGLLAMDRMLKHPEQDKNWWTPLRRGQTWIRYPRKAVVEYSLEGKMEIEFLFA